MKKNRKYLVSVVLVFVLYLLTGKTISLLIYRINLSLLDLIKAPLYITRYSNIKKKEIYLEEKLKLITKENEELKGILNLRDSGIEIIVSRVIKRIPDLASRKIIIDKGREHGLEKKMFIFTIKGLLGQIMRVNKTTSVCLLINDPTLYLPLYTKGGARLLVKGNGKNKLVSEYVNNIHNLEIAEPVYLLPLVGPLLSNLIVGRIERIDKKRNKVEVKPSADLNTPEFVIIYKRKEKR